MIFLIRNVLTLLMSHTSSKHTSKAIERPKTYQNGKAWVFPSSTQLNVIPKLCIDGFGFPTNFHRKATIAKTKKIPRTGCQPERHGEKKETASLGWQPLFSRTWFYLVGQGNLRDKSLSFLASTNLYHFKPRVYDTHDARLPYKG